MLQLKYYIKSHAGQVFRATAECTRSAVTRAWVRMWRFSAWKTARSAAVAKPLAPGPAGWVRDQDKGSRSVAVEDDPQWQRDEDHIGRQQKGVEKASRPSVHSICCPHACNDAALLSVQNPLLLTHMDARFCCPAERWSLDAPCLSPNMIVI